jgi:hypothetical protein
MKPEVGSGKSERGLEFWVIYEHPADYPHSYVLRRHRLVLGAEEAVPDNEAVIANSPDVLREFVQQNQCHNLGRQPGDDPCILEVWIA